jgi:hypothetical protein
LGARLATPDAEVRVVGVVGPDDLVLQVDADRLQATTPGVPQRCGEAIGAYVAPEVRRVPHIERTDPVGADLPAIVLAMGVVDSGDQAVTGRAGVEASGEIDRAAVNGRGGVAVGRVQAQDTVGDVVAASVLSELLVVEVGHMADAAVRALIEALVQRQGRRQHLGVELVPRLKYVGLDGHQPEGLDPVHVGLSAVEERSGVGADKIQIDKGPVPRQEAERGRRRPSR